MITFAGTMTVFGFISFIAAITWCSYRTIKWIVDVNDDIAKSKRDFKYLEERISRALERRHG